MICAYQPEQLRRFKWELVQRQTLVERVLRELPPVEFGGERVIRCSPENVGRAICRAFARCREWGEFWLIEVVE